MAEITPKDIKDITGDGGKRSRKLWAFIILLVISFPLIWYDKIGTNEIALLLGLYLIYCAGNVAAKQVLTGGKLWGLLTSTKEPNK
jgi:hypothetical protein